MASTSGSLQVAINPPDIEAPILARPRLLKLIERYRRRRIVLLHAPAGYGKTTLLADFHRNSDVPACWLRLSAADRDVMRLATVLKASLVNRFHRLRDQLDLQPLGSGPVEGLAKAFSETVEGKISEPFLMIFDDVQWINPSEQSTAFLDLLIRELPPNVTFILAGRELPRVSLARLVVDAEVGGIGTEELALNQEETGALVEQQFGLELSAAELSRLYRETQGWITGVLLSSPEGTLGAVSRAHEDLPHVMATVVLEGQPDPIQTFLLDSAVLPILTADACDQILERDGSAAILKDLVHKGLFITALRTRPKSYEYHPLLREALIGRLEQQAPERLRALRLRAATHYADRGDLEPAVGLYLAGGDLEQATQLAESSSRQLFEAGRLATLEQWGQELGEGQAACPRLFFAVATGAFDRSELEAAEEWCALAREAHNPDDHDPQLLVRFDILEGRIAIRRDQHERALELAELASERLAADGQLELQALTRRLKALALYRLRRDLALAALLAEEAVGLLEQVGNYYTAAQVLLDLSMINAALGEFPEAQSACQRAHDRLTEIGSPVPLAIATNNLAVLAHQRGHYDEAIDLFSEALQTIRQVGGKRLEASILMGQADLFNDLGLAYQAGDLYGEGLRIASRIQNQRLMRYGYLQTASLQRRSGNEDGALEWLDRARNTQDISRDTVAIALQSCALELTADPQAILQSLAQLQQSSNEQQPSAHEETLLLYYSSVASQLAGNREAARDHLRQAFTFASRRGTLQTLAGEMMHDRPMLEFAQEALQDHPAFRLLVHRIEFMELVASRYQLAHGDGEPPQLSLTALGEVQIRLAGERFTDLSPLPRQLLFFLADHDPVERDLLLETFWPGVSVRKQSSSLYTALHTLRDKLGEDLISIEGSLYNLSSKVSAQYDVREFERMLRVAQSIPKGDARRALALTQAIEAYGGPFLPEYHSDWVLERRRALEAKYLELLLDHSEAASAKGQHHEAISSLERAVALEPLREDINLRYLEMLHQRGRLSEAVRHYHRLVQQLSDELGVEASPELRQLYQDLIQ